MRTCTAAAVGLLVSSCWAAAGETQDWVEEALAWGANQKRVSFSFAAGSHSLRYSTPYQRVAMAACEARRQGRALERSSIPEDLVASELQVVAGVLPMGSGGRLTGMIGATAVTLVVSGERMRPSKVETTAVPMSAGAAGGDMRRFEGRELKAVFPLYSPIPPEATAIVEYSWVDAGTQRHTERSYKLDLKKSKW